MSTKFFNIEAIKRLDPPQRIIIMQGLTKLCDGSHVGNTAGNFWGYKQLIDALTIDPNDPATEVVQFYQDVPLVPHHRRVVCLPSYKDTDLMRVLHWLKKRDALADAAVSYPGLTQPEYDLIRSIIL